MNWRGAASALLVLALSTAASAGISPPVPLRNPPPILPDELATGEPPEASVRLSIDDRGAVSRVEIVAIAPASADGERIRELLATTLSRWRYAPQRRNGVAEPAVLEFKVRFPATGETERSAAADEVRADPLAAAGPPGIDAEARRARILALPERQRLALLEKQAMTAISMLDPARRRRATTARFDVHTDSDAGRAAEAVAENLEAIFNTLAVELFDGIVLQPERYKLQVVVYRDRLAYQRMIGSLPVFEWSDGFYSPAGLIALHLEQPSNDALLSVLLHEATHAFLDRHVVRRGVALPRWFGEGFAEYVGNSAIQKGRLVPGRTLRGKYEMTMAGVAKVRTTGALRLDEAKSALRRGRGLGVRELLSADPEIFYGERRSLYYASGWLLVHFLRDGSEGWANERFPRALLYLAEGHPQDVVIDELYGTSAALDEAFRDYVKRF